MEDLQEIISRRNKRLQKFWDSTGLKISLVGKDETPAIVWEGKRILSCYVHNFDLIFLNNNEGEEVYRIKLGSDSSVKSEERDFLMRWLYEAYHKECYYIAIKNTNLKLCGYNFTKKDAINPAGKYPVFAEKGFKVYFRRDSAERVVVNFKSNDLDLIIV